MSDLNDPRVLFAAERTLLAWSRTATGLMAFGFFVERAAAFGPQSSGGGFVWFGIAFIMLGVALSGISVVHYRRAIASLRPVEIPAGYWVNFSAYMTGLMAILGLALAAYMLVQP